jgi:glycerol-3-phosphate acyltransferase PlsY
MKILLCLIIGYAWGLISPAALVSKIKNTDLRATGTKNLGATNTFLSIGKLCGVLVMCVDILKSFLACKICRFLFPELLCSEIWAGIGAIIGHIFPFYMKFKGGKGLAAYAGLVLAFDFESFLILAIICTFLMIIVNYSVAMPISAAALFPVLAALKTHSWGAFLIALWAGIIIVISHFEIVLRIKNNEEEKVRNVIKEKLF